MCKAQIYACGQGIRPVSWAILVETRRWKESPLEYH